MHEPLTIHYNDEGIADATPTYLFDQAETYRENPRDAALEWFTEAHIGLSVFLGLSSLMGRHEDVLQRENLPLDKYAAMQQQFKCEHFDAVDIVELAISCGARYILFPACYDDGFCLFNTAQTDFNSVKSAANRDFVAELSSVCEYHGIGLALEYSLGVNAYKYPNGIPAEAHDEYLAFVQAQLHELMNSYGDLAAISFGGINRFRKQMPSFKVQDCYDLLHALQPQTLVSFRQGVNGKEDFYSLRESFPAADAPEDERGFFGSNSNSPIELRYSLTPGGRGYNCNAAGKHLGGAALWEELRLARRSQANLLINTALMPDGSLDLEDINTLIELGKRLEKEGSPS